MTEPIPQNFWMCSCWADILPVIGWLFAFLTAWLPWRIWNETIQV
jgi:hypothetical protein